MLHVSPLVEHEPAKTRRSFQSFLEKNEKLLVIMLCVIALVRIFIFSAAFPFFNNIDEQFHFDTVVKHARGYMPCKECNFFDQEAAGHIVRHGTPEYFIRTPILFRQPVDPVAEDVLLTYKNHEAFSPPVYYMIAGAWYNLGKLVGIHGGYLLYWIRFLNLPIYALFLWLAYLFCRFTEPSNLYLRLAVVLLLSVIPQDVFYSINSDVLSPLFFISGLFLLSYLYVGNHRLWLYPLAGVMIAGTVLIKLSNLPVLLIFGIILLMLFNKIRLSRQLAEFTPRVLTMIAAVAVPLIIWTSLNYYNLGNLTGTSEKIRHLGWSAKSFSELGNHPVFTPRGIIEFSSELTESFWRGEFIWHGEELVSESADAMYILTTLVFGIAGFISIIYKKNTSPSDNTFFNYMHLCIILLYGLFLVILSIRYDYGNCVYPSKEFPYLVSGRLILASLVSFLIIYVKGIEFFTAKISRRIDPMIIVILIVVYSGCSEIMITLEKGVFASPYNFFHL
jgi:hypothetical protein